MIYQNDSRLPSHVQISGCYFLSILRLALGDRYNELTVSDIQRFYDDCAARGWMRPSCYVLDPAAIFNQYSVKKAISIFHADTHYHTKVNELEILRYGLKYGNRELPHFVVGCNGKLSWDPWPDSIVSTRGSIISKRVFRIEV